MILISLLSSLALQAQPALTPDQTLRAVALCVAVLEYPDAHPEAGAARLAWREVLSRVPDSDAASQDAAVAAHLTTFEETAQRANHDGADVARAIGRVAPNCVTNEGAQRAAARLAAEAGS